jgi:hypothetical protein
MVVCGLAQITLRVSYQPAAMNRVVWAVACAALLAEQPPALEEVRGRTAAYVADFERQPSGLVTEEDYVQAVRFLRPVPTVSGESDRGACSGMLTCTSVRNSQEDRTC